MKNYTHFFLLILFSIFSCTFNVNVNLHKKHGKNILVLSDIHLDNLYDTSSSNTKEGKCRNMSNLQGNKLHPLDFGRYMCNTNMNLLMSALAHAYMKNKIDMIILAGDLIAHGIYKLNLNNDKETNKKLFKKTFEDIIMITNAYFPGVEILPVLGNNDLLEHYDTPSKDSKKEQMNYLKNLYFKNELTQNNFKGVFNKDFEETINQGFYYTYTEFDTKFIILNSNFYARKNTLKNKNDMETQLNWLENQLKMLKSEDIKSFVVFHISPFPFLYKNEPHINLDEDFINKFENLMYEYRDYIIAVLSAHNHYSKIGIRTRNNIPFMPTFSLPAVSPEFLNNPSYCVIKYNKHLSKINNIITYHADLKKTLTSDLQLSINKAQVLGELWPIRHSWKDFLVNFDSISVNNFIKNKLNKKDVFEKYMLVVSGYPENNEKEFYESVLTTAGMVELNNINKYICTLSNFTLKELETCQNTPQ